MIKIKTEWRIDMERITVQCRNRNNVGATVSLPKICPHCGEKMTPKVITDAFSENSSIESLIEFGLLVRCSATECREYFALQYTRVSENETKLKKYIYRPPITVDLPENIECVSPSFVEIYTQATKAEEEGLDQIAGVGYRKSLEFLVKDYVIFLEPKIEENVKKSFLGNVIENHLSHLPRLQNLAKAATWIGNDETHYVRRHDDKDIRDMKQFIKSTAHFVVADYDSMIAEQFINSDE